MVGQQLQRQNGEQRLQTFQRVGNVNHIVGPLLDVLIAFGRHNNHWPLRAFTSSMLAMTFSYTEFFGQRKTDGVRIDERDGAVFHLRGGIALGVDVGDFLELQRAFERDGEVDLARQEQEAVGVAVFLGDGRNRVALLEHAFHL